MGDNVKDLLIRMRGDMSELQGQFKSLTGVTRELVTALDKIQGANKNVEKSSKDAGDAVERFGQRKRKAANEGTGFGRILQTLSQEMGKFSFSTWVAWMNTNLWTNVIEGAVSKVDALVQAGSKYADMQAGFESLTRSAGMSSSLIMQATKTTTNSLLTQQQVMKSVNTMTALGIKTNEEGFATIAGAAVKMSKVMGTDVEYAMNSLATGLARQSIRVLDNIGVTFKAGEANEWWAKSHHTVISAMTKTEEKAAWLGYAIKMLKENAEKSGDTISTMGMAFNQAKVSFQDMFQQTMAWIVTQPEAINAATTFRDAVKELGDKFWESRDKIKDMLIEVVNIGTKMSEMLGRLVTIITTYKTLIVTILSLVVAYKALSVAHGIYIALSKAGTVSIISGLIPGFTAASSGLSNMAGQFGRARLLGEGFFAATKAGAGALAGTTGAVLGLVSSFVTWIAIAIAAGMALRSYLDSLSQVEDTMRRLNTGETKDFYNWFDKLVMVFSKGVNVADKVNTVNELGSRMQATQSMAKEIYGVQFADYATAQEALLQAQKNVKFIWMSVEHKSSAEFEAFWAKRNELERVRWFQEHQDLLQQRSFFWQKLHEADSLGGKVTKEMLDDILHGKGKKQDDKGEPVVPKKTIEQIFNLSPDDIISKGKDLQKLIIKYGPFSPVVLGAEEGIAKAIKTLYDNLPILGKGDDIRMASDMARVIASVGHEYEGVAKVFKGEFAGEAFSKEIEKGKKGVEGFHIALLKMTTGVGLPKDINWGPNFSDEKQAEYLTKITQLADQGKQIFNDVMMTASPAQQFADDFKAKLDDMTKYEEQALKDAREAGWGPAKLAEISKNYDDMIAQMKESNSGLIAQLASDKGGGLADVFLALQEQIQTTGQMLGNFTVSIVQGMNNSFSNFFNSVMMHNKSLSASFKDLGKEMASSIVGALSKILAQMVINFLLEKAMKKSIHKAETNALASKAFAYVYNSASAIPFVGWIIAPIAAAAAYLLVKGYLMAGGAGLKSGAWEIPGGIDTPYPTTLHGQEMVVQAGPAEKIRRFVDSVTQPAGNQVTVQVTIGGGGDLMVLDSPDVGSSMGQKLASVLIPHIQQAIRNNQATLDPYKLREQ